MTGFVACELALLDPAAVLFRADGLGAARLVPLPLDELAGCRDEWEGVDVDADAEVEEWGVGVGAEVSENVGLGRAYSVVHSRAVLSCCLRLRLYCCATDGTTMFP